jgi:hypothetical protein
MRLSLLAFYYRLVNDAGKEKFRCFLHATVAFVVILFVVSMFLGIFTCLYVLTCAMHAAEAFSALIIDRPVQSYWMYPPPPNQKCYDEGTVGFVVAIINCIADLIITCLPIPLVMRLNMPLRNRLGVLVLFCLGFIVLIASILRTYYYYAAYVGSYDETWEAYPLWIAAGVEVNVGLVCIIHITSLFHRPNIANSCVLARLPYEFLSKGNASLQSAVWEELSATRTPVPIQPTLEVCLPRSMASMWREVYRPRLAFFARGAMIIRPTTSPMSHWGRCHLSNN